MTYTITLIVSTDNFQLFRADATVSPVSAWGDAYGAGRLPDRGWVPWDLVLLLINRAYAPAGKFIGFFPLRFGLFLSGVFSVDQISKLRLRALSHVESDAAMSKNSFVSTGSMRTSRRSEAPCS